MLHGGNHTCGDHPFTYSASHKDTAVRTKNVKFGLIRTKNRFPPLHCSCFLAQASVVFLLVSFSSGFFTIISPRRPDSRSLLWTVDVEMCLLLELCDAAISEAGNANECILCSRGNCGSSFPRAVLMRASFIITFDSFSDCTWRNFQSSWNFPFWLTFMSLSNGGLWFIFVYLICSCHNMDLFFYQIGLSSVYHPYLVTTQLIGSNALRTK